MTKMLEDLAEVVGSGDAMELIAKSANFICTHHATITDMAKRADVLQSLAAAMYQAAGTYDMPVRFLDILSAAGNGDQITDEQVDALLPCYAPDMAKRLEAAERDVARLNFVEQHPDWMNVMRFKRKHLWRIGPFSNYPQDAFHTLREAIDAAMQESGEWIEGVG